MNECIFNHSLLNSLFSKLASELASHSLSFFFPSLLFNYINMSSGDYITCHTKTWESSWMHSFLFSYFSFVWSPITSCNVFEDPKGLFWKTGRDGRNKSKKDERKVGGMWVVKDSIPCLLSLGPSSCSLINGRKRGPSSCGLINGRKTVLEWMVYFVTTITTWEITTFTSLFLFSFLSLLSLPFFLPPFSFFSLLSSYTLSMESKRKEGRDKRGK